MKKRLFTLCLALTAMTLGVMAEEVLYVCGDKVYPTSVSGAEKVSYFSENIKGGGVEYNCITKTLTLKNLTITCSGNNVRAIRSNISGLTVRFVGTNTITTTSAAGLRFEANTTITGSGTVTVNSDETALYVYKKTTVTIKGEDRNRLTLNLDGKYGIQGEDGKSSEKVSIQRYVTLTAKATSNALKYLNDLTVNGDPRVTLKGNDPYFTVASLTSLTLGEGVAIDLPLKGKFDSSKKTIVKGSATTGYTGDVTIMSAVAINETNFPDAKFRSFITSSAYDQNSDGHLSNAEIQPVTKINVKSKGISNLKGIGYFTALTDLVCSNNNLQSLDVTSNTALKKLDCSSNSLTSLDVSKNTALTELYCPDNQIKGVAMNNLVNGLPNTDGTLYVCKKDAANDNVITSSQVSVATGKGWTVKRYENSGSEWEWVAYIGFLEPVAINATNFPDEKFRNYLLAQSYGKDAVLTEDEMLTITELDVSKKGISKLIGIEHFTALKYLYCYDNSLTSLDVSKNTTLIVLECSDNRLESLDVTKNTELRNLHCFGNSLTSLDVSKNTEMKNLYCSRNSLKSLDVSKNTALTYLSCYGNQISGDGMTQLLNSLPPRTTGNYGELFVCSDHLFPDNIITSAQVKIATRKGWKVAKGIVCAGDNKRYYAGLGDVNGDIKIDQTDLDTIVKIIMGQVELGYAGDLNNDGKTDAADVVVMVNILKALGVK